MDHELDATPARPSVRRIATLRWSDPPDSSPALTLLRVACAIALVANVGAHVAMFAQGRYFASEDDGYRAYLSYLFARGGGTSVGRFWLPGQFYLVAALVRVGVEAATAPLALAALCTTAVVLSLRSLARDLSPPGWGEHAAWGATFVVLTSPLETVLAHSALAEPVANAFVAIAAAAIARYSRNGRRRALLLSSASLLAATWIRYEAWLLAAAWPVLTYALSRRRGTMRAAVVDATLSALACVGPLAWMIAQARVYGDPLAFLALQNDMSRFLASDASWSAVLITRLRAFITWMPATIGWAALAFSLRRARRALAAVGVVAAFGAIALVIALAAGKGFGIFVVDGRVVEFFSARLASTFELSIAPIAGLGVAAVIASSRRSIIAASCAATIFAIALAPTRKLDFVDDSSQAAGVRLRRGELDDRIGAGALLVERPRVRPPLGWAAVGVLWGKWERTVWGTPEHHAWLMVEPVDVHDGRSSVASSELEAWLARRGVTAAWTVSVAAREDMLRAWPQARVFPIGSGALVTR